MSPQAWGPEERKEREFDEHCDAVYRAKLHEEPAEVRRIVSDHVAETTIVDTDVICFSCGGSYVIDMTLAEAADRDSDARRVFPGDICPRCERFGGIEPEHYL